MTLIHFIRDERVDVCDKQAEDQIHKLLNKPAWTEGTKMSWIKNNSFRNVSRNFINNLLYYKSFNENLFFSPNFKILQSILKRKTVTHIHSKKLATDNRKQCLHPKQQVSIHRYYLDYIFPNF